MTKVLKHRFQSSVADGTDATQVRPSNWNDDHDFWLGMRSASTTSDTISNADHCTFIRYTNVGAIAVSLAAPSGGNMPNGWTTKIKNVQSPAGVTVTIGSGTINGASALVLARGEAAQIFSDGTADYAAIVSLSPYSAAFVQQAGLVLLNTLVASSSANLTDTTSITSAYDSYEFELLNLVPSSTPVNFAMLAQVGGAFVTTGYNCYVTGALGAGTNIGTDVSAGGSFLLSGNGANLGTVGTIAGAGLSGVLHLHGPNSSVRKYISGQTSWLTPGAVLNSAFINGFLNNNGVITGVQLAFTAGNISAGTVRIYGRKTS
jgi:hypothetical protein